MTDTTRLNLIQSTLKDVLNNNNTTINAIHDLNVSTKEWLALAFNEEKLPADFDVSPFLVVVDEDEKWEEQQRKQREIDDVLATTHTVIEVDNDCKTCGATCVSYEMDGETHWLCEECYYGTNTASTYSNEFVYGYDGADEV